MRKLKISVAFPTLMMLVAFILSGQTKLLIGTVCAAAIHELGHIIAAYLMKIPIFEFSLDIFGARLKTGVRLLSYADEIKLSSAGPVANFLSIIAFLPSAHNILSTDGILSSFFAASLALGLLNLLPIPSFDGGRILVCTISYFWDSEKAEKTVKYISFLFIFALWSLSSYLLLRTGTSLSLFIFTLSIFAKFFVSE